MVSGRAIIIPNMPIREPHTESESRMMAGLSPVILPMTRGTMKPSSMACTTANTAKAASRMSQKLPPVSAAFKMAKTMVGMNPMICRYGTRLSTPMKRPKAMASGKSMIKNPMLNNEWAVTQRHQAGPPLGDAFIIHQDKDDVEQDDEDGKHAVQHAERAGQQGPQGRDGFLECVQQVLLLEDVFKDLRVNVLAQEVRKVAGNVAGIAIGGKVFEQQIFYPSKLLNHRRYQQVKDCYSDSG